MSFFTALPKYGRFVLNGVIRRKPVQLTLFITSRCNVRCKMCFYWEPVEAKSSEEITLDEVRRIAVGIGPLFWLLIGGASRSCART